MNSGIARVGVWAVSSVASFALATLAAPAAPAGAAITGVPPAPVSAAVVTAVDPGPGPIPGPGWAGLCGWRAAVAELYAQLAGALDTRGIALRGVLGGAGVEQPGFLPAQCGPDTAGPAVRSATGPGAASSGPDGDGITAAAAYHWGAPDPGLSDEFTGTAAPPGWDLYDSAGNGGNGVRRPAQDTAGHGYLQIAGLADATSGGMMSDTVQPPYGRWEVRMRVDKHGTGGAYHPVVALIPAGVPYHGGAGDLDLAEADAGSGQVSIFIHYPPGKQDYSTAAVDLAQWHNYGVEVAPDHLTWFLDGRAVMTDTDPAAVPATGWTRNIQLDANQPGGEAPSDQQVAYFRYYRIPPGGAPVIAAPPPLTGGYR